MSYILYSHFTLGKVLFSLCFQLFSLTVIIQKPSHWRILCFTVSLSLKKLWFVLLGLSIDSSGKKQFLNKCIITVCFCIFMVELGWRHTEPFQQTATLYDTNRINLGMTLSLSHSLRRTSTDVSAQEQNVISVRHHPCCYIKARKRKKSWQ